MLSKIVFCIGSRQTIRQIEELKARIGGGNTEIEILVSDDSHVLPISGYGTENLLVVTDKKELLECLMKSGYCTIAYLHEFNMHEDLSAASYAVSNVQELLPEDFMRAYLRLKGEPLTIMETERCIIRETTVEDVDSFYRIYEEPSITDYMEGLFDDREEEREYTREYIKKVYGFYGYGLWSILEKKSGDIIGRAGLSWREGFQIPELGFVIAVPYQGKGYAYEVCRAILAYGREELQFTAVQALIKKENKASVSLCKKLGFQKKDEVVDRGQPYERYIKYDM